MKVQFFRTPASFRRWLTSNSTGQRELWVGFYKRSSGKPSITYSESVDQALCFGWIDGVRKSLGANAYTVRFTPRGPASQWSAVNIRRVRRLSDAGLMRPAGMKAFAGATGQSRTYSYEQRNAAGFNPEAERSFRSNAKAWDFFQSQPPWYRRTATFWVASAKKEETRLKRLATLISDCAEGRHIKPLRRPSKSSTLPAD